MGMYFEIELVNLRTKEVIYEEYWSKESGTMAWQRATEYAVKKFTELWSVEGDAKYWVLKSITDVTRR